MKESTMPASSLHFSKVLPSDMIADIAQTESAPASITEEMLEHFIPPIATIGMATEALVSLTRESPPGAPASFLVLVAKTGEIPM